MSLGISEQNASSTARLFRPIRIGSRHLYKMIIDGSIDRGGGILKTGPDLPPILVALQLPSVHRLFRVPRIVPGRPNIGSDDAGAKLSATYSACAANLSGKSRHLWTNAYGFN